MSRLKMLIPVLAFGFLGLGASTGGNQTVGKATLLPQLSQMQQVNEILLGSASPFEDMTEFAIAADESGIDHALAAIEGRSEITRSALDLARRKRFDALLARIRAARKAGAFTDVALDSVEAYRVLVESLHEEALLVPQAVSLLDYTGFRLTVLASSETPDWAAIRATIEEARGFWATIAGRVERKGLHDAMNTTIDGLEQAVEARDARMAAFAARVDLDLVDLLESYFTESSHVVRGGQ